MSDEQPIPSKPGLTRARLLKQAGVAAAALGVGGGLTACGDDEAPTQVPTDTNATAFPPVTPMAGMPGMTGTQGPLNHSVMSFFTKDEAETVDAIVGRLIPGSPDDPGAREAAVPMYIDMKLAQFDTFAAPTYFHPPFAKAVAVETGPQPGAKTTIRVKDTELPRYGFQGGSTPREAYRSGLHALDLFTLRMYGARFAGLEAAKQDSVLALLEAGEAPGFPEANGFFKLVLEDTYEGMFADPSYGGNRDYIGWKLVGYPGAQRAYTASELKHGPLLKHVQGLRDMPAMNPGVPQDHVLLPISGTRPHKRAQG